MDNMPQKRSAHALIEQWQAAGLLQSGAIPAITAWTLAHQQETEAPLYLRILAGVGAFIATLCFIGFLSISRLIDFNSAAMLTIWGLLLAGGALLLARSARTIGTEGHSFLLQLSFCAMGTGKILFVLGMKEYFSPHDGWGITTGIAIITLLCYPVYRLSLDRFLSTLGLFLSLYFNLLSDSRQAAGIMFAIPVSASIIAMVALAGGIFTHSKIPRTAIPVGYAALFALWYAIGYPSGLALSFSDEKAAIISFVVTRLSLTFALLGAIIWAVGDVTRLKQAPMPIALLAAAVLGAGAPSGLTLALCVLIIGYARHEKLLVTLGLIALPLFLLRFYHELEMTLLLKSGLLVASGFILLLGRAYLQHRGLTQEVRS